MAAKSKYVVTESPDSPVTWIIGDPYKPGAVVELLPQQARRFLQLGRIKRFEEGTKTGSRAKATKATAEG